MVPCNIGVYNDDYYYYYYCNVLSSLVAEMISANDMLLGTECSVNVFTHNSALFSLVGCATG